MVVQPVVQPAAQQPVVIVVIIIIHNTLKFQLHHSMQIIPFNTHSPVHFTSTVRQYILRKHTDNIRKASKSVRDTPYYVPIPKIGVMSRPFLRELHPCL